MRNKEDRRIRESWDQYLRDGSTVGHMRRVLQPDTRKRVDWAKVIWFSFLLTLGGLVGACLWIG